MRKGVLIALLVVSYLLVGGVGLFVGRQLPRPGDRPVEMVEVDTFQGVISNVNVDGTGFGIDGVGAWETFPGTRGTELIEIGVPVEVGVVHVAGESDIVVYVEPLR